MSKKVELDDTTAFGMGNNHNHDYHRVYISGLNYQDAKELQAEFQKIVDTYYKKNTGERMNLCQICHKKDAVDELLMPFKNIKVCEDCKQKINIPSKKDLESYKK